jgi:hypothetical protein
MKGVKSMLSNKHLDWRFEIGVPRDFWIVHAVDVERFIKANKLKAVSQAALQERAGGQTVVARKLELPQEVSNAPWWWKYGGMRVPHLHYEGNTFLLNAEQWKAFSGGVMKEFSKKLAEANAVNFGQMMDLSESVNEIT